MSDVVRLPRVGLVLAGALAANAAVQQAAEAAGTASVVAGLGSSALLWLWPASMLVVAAATIGLAALGDRVGRADLVRRGLALVAGGYLALQVLAWAGVPVAGVSAALYLLTDIQAIAFPMAVWALANDMFAPAEGRRLFPLIGSGAVVGTIVGDLLAGTVGLAQAAPDHLLWLGALPLAGAVLALRLWHDAAPAPRAGAPPVRETLATFSAVPMLRWLLGAFGLVQVGMTVIEYHFLGVTRAWLEARPDAITACLGLTSLGMLVLTALVEWGLAGRLQQRAGTKNAFPVMPIALVATAVMMLAATGFSGAVAAFGLSGIVLSAWDDPTRKTVQGLLPQAQHAWAGFLMDVLPYALGTAVACGVLALIAFARLAFLDAAFAAAAAAGALALAFRARSLYDGSLLNWRLSRGRRSSVLESLDL